MNKQSSILIFIVVTLFITLLLAEDAKPKRINWAPSYSANDKNPYGAYILRQEMPKLFPAQKVESQEHTIYETFRRSFDARQHLRNGDFSYIFINRLFSPSETDFQILTEFVENGGNVFISAQLFKKEIADKLGIKTSYFFLSAQDSTSLRMVNPHLGNVQNYAFKRGTVSEYFKKHDYKTTRVLAVNSHNKPVLLRKKYGKGVFYLNSTPLAFTNFHMVLNDNAKFVAKVFSYLPDQPIYWDEYYKEGRIHNNSRLRFILSRESLRWAWWLTISGLLVFIFFEGRRTQRIIPVIKPLPNTTLEFTETVGRLYYQWRDHKNIAEKRITHFLEYIRTHMYLTTHQFDEDFYNKMVSKTGQSKEGIVQLFRLIQQIQEKEVISDSELLYLSSRIDQLKAVYEDRRLSNDAFSKPQQRFNTHIIFGVFWIITGSVAALSYAMAASGNTIYLFLAIVVIGIGQTTYGINCQMQRSHYRVKLGEEIKSSDAKKVTLKH